MPLAQSLTEHSAGGLGEPVVDRSEYHEDDRADQYVVEMRDDEVGIGELPVERRDGEHDAGQARDQKLEQERHAEQHRYLEAKLPPHIVPSQLKILMPVGTPTSIVEVAKNELPAGVMPTVNM